MSERPSAARETLKLMTFMLSSAKLLATEPKSYGPYRLIDAAGRLAEAMEKCGLADDAVRALGEEIEKEKYYGLNDEAEVAAFLDRVLEIAAAGMRRKEGPSRVTRQPG